MKIIQVIILLIICNNSFSSDYVQLTKKLAALRVEVEEKNKEVQEIRETNSRQLKELSIQNAELESSIRKEEVTKKQLSKKLVSLKRKIKKNDKGVVEIKPIVLDGINTLSEYIETSIPYKKSERLKNLNSLKAELKNNELSSYIALSRLWSALEDESRLMRSSHTTTSSIEIAGKKYLGTVLHVGSLVQLFQLEDGRYGETYKENETWINRLLVGAENISAAEELFSGMKKQIKVAAYKLPNRFGRQ